MKNILANINREFENRVRLGIMSVLMVNEEVDFPTLKSLLELTDGNLSSHASALEKRTYISISKEFVGRKPKTTYRITEEGRKAFEAHLNALEALIRNKK